MKPDYTITNNNIHLYNSYLTPKKEFVPTLKEIGEDNPENLVIQNRSVSDMKYEWAVHNFLYNLGIEKERTKDTNLEWPRKCREKLVYNILGFLVWPWID